MDPPQASSSAAVHSNVTPIAVVFFFFYIRICIPRRVHARRATLAQRVRAGSLKLRTVQTTKAISFGASSFYLPSGVRNEFFLP